MTIYIVSSQNVMHALLYATLFHTKIV